MPVVFSLCREASGCGIADIIYIRIGNLLEDLDYMALMAPILTYKVHVHMKIGHGYDASCKCRSENSFPFLRSYSHGTRT